MNPLVSIVIPNYNNGIYLKYCIGSCINQTYMDIEIIVVDDCSTDNSVQIANDIMKSDGRITLIQNKTNLKVAATRHVGIGVCSGEWLTTLDSDDFYISNRKLENELNALRECNFDKRNIAYSGIVLTDANGVPLRPLMSRDTVKTGSIFEDLITLSCPIPNHFLFSKYIYDIVGWYDVSLPLYEDWDLKLRLAKESRFVFSGADDVAYRRHANSLTSTATGNDLQKWLWHVFEKSIMGSQNKNELQRELRRILKNMAKPRQADAT